jgi:hypothetical protein
VNKLLEWGQPKRFIADSSPFAKMRVSSRKWEGGRLEDALLGLARELLPQSPAAQWDAEWAYQLCTGSLARLAERHVELSAAEKEALDLSGLNAWDERMHAAGVRNDSTAFRAALKGWEQAGLEAMERVRVKGGAA